MRVREVIVVEGRYDVNTLKQAVEATVVETRGFGIFKDRERLELLRRLAEARGLIVLTDSDGAGFVIRNFLRGALPKGQVKHAYIPELMGKERRKSAPSREGKLGVEGMTREVIREALLRAGATLEDGADPSPRAGLTKADFYRLGLSGGADSARRRSAVLRALNLPQGMTANALLEAVNLLMDGEAFEELCRECLE